jgi:TonB family protein
LGTDPNGNLVAIKEMLAEFVNNAELRKRFHQEINILKTLEHPAIVKMYASFEERGNLYLVMEYVNGVTVGEYVRRHGVLSEKEAMRIISELLEALQLVHSHGYVHRDIKPGNIMIRPDGSVCLLDFGIAKDMNRVDKGMTSFTSFGAAIGTVGYMSPEQAEGNNIDHRSDIYSLGCVLFYMLTGQHAVKEESNEIKTRLSIINNPFPSAKLYNPNISNNIQTVLSKATDKNMTKRFQSCHEFADRLKHYTVKQQPQPSPVTDPKTQGRTAHSGNETPLCSNCQSTDVERVRWNWWGGLIGAALVKEYQCKDCGKTFRSNAAANVASKNQSISAALSEKQHTVAGLSLLVAGIFSILQAFCNPLTQEIAAIDLFFNIFLIAGSIAVLCKKLKSASIFLIIYASIRLLFRNIAYAIGFFAGSSGLPEIFLFSEILTIVPVAFLLFSSALLKSRMEKKWIWFLIGSIIFEQILNFIGNCDIYNSVCFNWIEPVSIVVHCSLIVFATVFLPDKNQKKIRVNILAFFWCWLCLWFAIALYFRESSSTNNKVELPFEETIIYQTVTASDESCSLEVPDFYSPQQNIAGVILFYGYNDNYPMVTVVKETKKALKAVGITSFESYSKNVRSSFATTKEFNNYREINTNTTTIDGLSATVIDAEAELNDVDFRFRKITIAGENNFYQMTITILKNVLDSQTDLVDKISYSFMEVDTEKVYPMKKIQSKVYPIFSHAEVPPSFPGGEKEMMKYLMDNIQYPAIAQEQGIQGRVILRFVVTPNGSIEKIEVLHSLDPNCDKEAMRLVKNMPKWNPGRQNGSAVYVYYTLPILFRFV